MSTKEMMEMGQKNKEMLGTVQTIRAFKEPDKGRTQIVMESASEVYTFYKYPDDDKRHNESVVTKWVVKKAMETQP